MIICNDIAKNNTFSSKTLYLKEMNILLFFVSLSFLFLI